MRRSHPVTGIARGGGIARIPRRPFFPVNDVALFRLTRARPTYLSHMRLSHNRHDRSCPTTPRPRGPHPGGQWHTWRGTNDTNRARLPRNPFICSVCGRFNVFNRKTGCPRTVIPDPRSTPQGARDRPHQGVAPANDTTTPSASPRLRGHHTRPHVAPHRPHLRRSPGVLSAPKMNT